MTIVNVGVGDVVETLTLDEASALTESIRASVADLEEQVVRAYFGRVWVAMGYGSWDDYVQGEFKQAPLQLPREDRRVQIASLRSQGLSMPAIAAATGASVGTVYNDLEPFSSEQLPDRITGLDGRERPATRPPVPRIEPETNDTPPEPREACPTCGQLLPINLRKG